MGAPPRAAGPGSILLELELLGTERVLSGCWPEMGLRMVDPGVGAADGIGFARGGNCKIKGRRASKPPEQPD